MDALKARVLRDRIRKLLQLRWNGGTRRMSRDLKVSPALVSRTLAGDLHPGPKLLDALAAHPGINSEWLWTGTGKPLIADPEIYGTSAQLLCPVADEYLAGPPAERRLELLLSGRSFPVLQLLHRPSVYLRELRPSDPIVGDPNEAARAGDLLVIDGSPEWQNSGGLLRDRLCVVKNSTADDCAELARIIDIGENGEVTANFFSQPKTAGPHARAIQFEAATTSEADMPQFGCTRIRLKDVAGVVVSLIRQAP